MNHSNINKESRKNKHLNYEERIIIQLRLKGGAAPYKIAKEYYSKHRLNSYRTFKLLECSDFKMVCTKTLYRYWIYGCKKYRFTNETA